MLVHTEIKLTSIRN